MIRQIFLADQPIIRRKLKPVKDFGPDLKQFVQDLTDTMVFANGAGLAANQIGSDLQIFAVGITQRPQVFINPKLKILSSKSEILDEGCLSIPGYRGEVKRSNDVELTFDDLKGRRKKILAKGFLARVIQHEYDHLQGKLYIDHIKNKDDIKKVEPVKIAFFGSGEFAVPILVSLVGLNWTFDFRTVGVITQPSRPAGRERRLASTPVKEAAEKFGLPTLTPEKIDQKFITEFKKWQIDLIILADYGLILPKTLLSLPKLGGLNVHPSLLPKYRGSSPIQYAILNGDQETGVSLIKMSEKVDQGGLLAQYRTKIGEEETSANLSRRLSELAAVMIRDILPYYVSEEIKPKPQPKKGSVAPKITGELGRIDPTDKPELVLRKVRALNPEPGVYKDWQGKRVKILSAHLDNDSIIPDQIQPEGGRVMSWQEFKNGYPGFSLP